MEVAALSPERQRRDAAALGDEIFDVLVVGGGIVGAGAALDAAARGLSVAIVEATDWAAGTSSRSSKLIHGGLRYLRSGDVSLVREALRERAILLGLAPHLVHAAKFLYPLRRRIERPYVGAGLALYDLLARMPGSRATLPRARHLGARAARTAAPALRPGRVAGAFVYFDAQMDDARLALAVVRTAASLGARVVSRARVTSFLQDSGRTTGAVVHLVDDGAEVRVSARSVVVAAGVWTGDIEGGEGSGLELRPSKGVHLVPPRDAIDATSALIVPTATSVLFVLPWGVHWIVGTTDTPYDGEVDDVVATSSDVDYLLGELNAILEREVAPSAIESLYVGLRPLIAGAASATTKLSREHAVWSPRPGLAFVAGGKYTTYRVMAKDLLDVALEGAGIRAGRCRSDSVLIAGTEGFAAREARSLEIATERGLTEDDVTRLLSRYGGLIDEVLDEDAIPDPLGRVAGAGGYLRAEIAYAVTHEGARHLDDVLVRRTRASIETRDRGTAAASEVASIMGQLLGWSDAAASDEVALYLDQVSTERRAEALPDEGTPASTDSRA